MQSTLHTEILDCHNNKQQIQTHKALQATKSFTKMVGFLIVPETVVWSGVFPCLQWLDAAKSGLRRDNWQNDNRVMGAQGSLMHVGKNGFPNYTEEMLGLKGSQK